MEERIISIKDYAKERNRSIQGVYQQMKRSANAELLKDHIILKTIGNREVKFLDEYAVDVLDQSRNNNPAVVVRTEQDDRIEELDKANKNLLIKIATQADKIIEQADKIIQQSEELEKNKKLLFESQAQSEEEKKKREEAEAKEKELNIKLQENLKESEQLHMQLQDLQEQLKNEKERKLSFSERLFGRKKQK